MQVEFFYSADENSAGRILVIILYSEQAKKKKKMKTRSKKFWLTGLIQQKVTIVPKNNASLSMITLHQITAEERVIVSNSR